MLVNAAHRAVIFDFFGTLTRAVTRGTHHTRIARMLGCEPDEFIDLLDRSFRERARGRYGSASQTLRWMCDRLGADPSDAVLSTVCAARVRAVREDTRLRPEAVPTLRALRRRGLRTAVLSDCTHELPAILPTLPVAPLLDAAVYSVDVRRCKPHPAMYGTVCRRLRVPPGECLYVGDGGSRELSGARDVGMSAVRLVAPDLAGHLTFDAERDWDGSVVGSLTEVEALVTPGRVLR